MSRSESACSLSWSRIVWWAIHLIESSDSTSSQMARQISGARLARDEFLVTGVLSLLIAVFTETITWEGVYEALIPILYAGILSGAVGYSLQIAGQRDTDPTVASLLMCLEAVFAVLTGTIVLGEKMTVRETVGCILMFSAVILAQLSPVISSLRRGGRFRR